MFGENGTELMALALIVVVLLGAPLGIYLYSEWHISQQVLVNDYQTIMINAWAVENGGWDPDKLILEKGKPTKLIIKSADVTHGFYSPELGLKSSPILPGLKETIEFTPEEVGNYTFICHVFCSEQHPDMKGEIIIVDGE